MYLRLLRALAAIERGQWAEFDTTAIADNAVKLWKRGKISTAEMHAIADRITVICGDEI